MGFFTNMIKKEGGAESEHKGKKSSGFFSSLSKKKHMQEESFISGGDLSEYTVDFAALEGRVASVTASVTHMPAQDNNAPTPPLQEGAPSGHSSNQHLIGCHSLDDVSSCPPSASAGPAQGQQGAGGSSLDPMGPIEEGDIEGADGEAEAGAEGEQSGCGSQGQAPEAVAGSGGAAVTPEEIAEELARLGVSLENIDSVSFMKMDDEEDEEWGEEGGEEEGQGQASGQASFQASAADVTAAAAAASDEVAGGDDDGDAVDQGQEQDCLSAAGAVGEQGEGEGDNGEEEEQQQQEEGEQGEGGEGQEGQTEAEAAEAEVVAEEEEVEDPHDPAESYAAADEIAERAAELAEAAHAAMAHRANCLALAAFGANIVHVLTARAPVLGSAKPAQLLKVADLLAEGTKLVSCCGQDGWLLLAASPDEGICEAMHALHSNMLATLKEERIADVPGGLRLPHPDYRDGSKTLHRRLRQLGAGNLAEGVEHVAVSDKAQLELSKMLGVEPEQVLADAQHIVAKGLVGAEPGCEAATNCAVAANRAALEQAFSAFATFGLRDYASIELDSFRCNKLVREAGLLRGGLSSQQLDLLFTQAKDRGARKLTFDAFLKLLALIAEKKRMPLDDVVEAVMKLEGPVARGTTPDYVKFHDDKSTWSGVYARGMSVTDETMDLSRMVDRDAAEKAQRRASIGARRASATPPSAVRTHAVNSSPAAAHAHGHGHGTSDGSCTPPAVAAARRLSLPTGGSMGRSPLRNAGHATLTPAKPHSSRAAAAAATPSSPRIRAHTPRDMHTPKDGSNQSTPGRSDAAGNGGGSEWEDLNTPALRLKFDAFAAFGKTSVCGATGGELMMDSAQFMKLCRDSRLLSKQLNSTRVDLIFRMLVPKGSRRIGYKLFLRALPRLADARGCGSADVVAAITFSEGPTHNNATVAESVRLHDDKSAYVGNVSVDRRYCHM